METKTELSPFHLFFLWFGASISVAEILTGGFLADLGWERGLWAILLGHLAGTLLLALGGLIGFRERLPAIRSTRISFGRGGSYLISGINVLQLIGWTAIMILEGGRAVTTVTATLWGFDHSGAAAGLIGLLIGVWVCIGVRNFKILNTIAVSLLFLLTLVMSYALLQTPLDLSAAGGEAPFGLGFELSIIMPLSWFPLIADYTSLSKTRRGVVAAPFWGYFIGSCWMYAIGLLGGLLSGAPDPTGMMLAANLGMVALMVIGLSTITTTFLDVYSAAVSSANIFPRIHLKATAVLFAGAGTLLAVYFPVERYIDFLYILGSIFAPLIAILLSDYFLLKVDLRDRPVDPTATASLIIGIGFYYLIKSADIVIGPTLTTILFTLVVHNLLRGVFTFGILKGRKAASGTRG